MRRLKPLMIKSALIVSAILTQSANAELIKHDSNPYLDDQYQIIKYMFLDLEVTKPSDKEIRVVIPTEYGFKTGKFDLKRPMKDKLRDLAKVLQDYNESTIDVVGHTDSVGSEKSNMKLGLNRANAVKNVLMEGKISHYRIDSYSEGEELPKCSNKSAKGRECNRRVEINIMLEKELARY